MPLPLIPLVLGGVALMTGGYGAKKGYDAKNDYQEAKSTNARAEEIYDSAQSDLEEARKKAKESLEVLGKQKLSIYENSLIPFVEAFSKLKKVNFEDSVFKNGEKIDEVTQGEMKEIEVSLLEVSSILQGGASSLGAGGLAGLATYGGVGLLGKASTGAAISTLSGAAAKNATLAWLGGGALKAGGLGVAGGTAVLGGLVAGPVLAVGGMMMASKAKEASENARSNLSNARLAAEEMKSAEVLTNGITRRIGNVNKVITMLSRYLKLHTQRLAILVKVNQDFTSYSKEDQERIYIAAATAKTLKSIMETPVINQDGILTKESWLAVKQGKEFLEKM